MAKLTIGFVLDDSLDKTDGVQQYVLTLGRWLSRAGHEVHYLVGETKRADISNVHSLSKNIKVRFNGNRMSMPAIVDRQAVSELFRSVSFDVLHVQVPYSPLLAGKIISLADARTVVFGTFHIAPYSAGVTLANKALGITLRHSLRRFDKIVAVSSAAQQFAEKCYGVQAAEIIPNVIDTTPYQGLSRKQPTTPTITFLGRLVPRKGCKVLLEAINLLKNTYGLPKVAVKIGGPGPLEQELKQYVVAQNLEDWVQFYGFIEEGFKPQFLAASTIAVFPSSGGESFGIVLLEAMAAGNPVVLGGDNVGYRSVLGEMPELLFDALDAQQLAAKLKDLLEDAAMRGRLVKWQMAHLGQFEVSHVGAKLINEYQQALLQRQKMR